MDINFSVLEAGVFRRIKLSVSENGKPAECELSAIITPPSGREEIFLPSPEKMLPNASYPHSGGRFVTCTGKGTYHIIFQPKEKGEHTLKIIGRILDRRRQEPPSSHFKPFEKVFQITL